MFDIGWGEFVVIGAVALVVIGPKELPSVLRTVGGAVSKLKRMAGDFQQQFNEAIRDSEFEEARKAFDGANNTINSTSTFNPIQTIREEIKNAVEGTGATPASTTPATTTPVTPSDVQATAPQPILDIPAPPPVPDLTPEQIHAAFASEPAAPVEEAAPPPKRRRARKADVVADAESAPAEPTTVAASSTEPVAAAGDEAEPAKPKRRPRKPKTTDDEGAAG
ncbi:Sec-independent protein translocase protein TatB [uncultured Alsobacter sp.]|uniref:Sec-independent protein translocase protein TatB n=1 Tax=uncultured Alsobacter sp. TaxID=1748258 RepID=UPI0025D5177E|nr:Sec-independent protein translocase protein TatB [uncultured Alsobacter sp.]